MFDEFIIDDVCPECGDRLPTIQSEKFICELHSYSIGDPIVFDTGIFINSGYLVENTYCSCKSNMKAKLFINDGKFSRYKLGYKV